MIRKIVLSVVTCVSMVTGVYAQNDEHAIADSLFFQQTLKSFAKGNNFRRYRYLKNYVKRNKLPNLSVKSEAIDWLGVYRNVIVEKKGQVDSVIYIVCHYDKIDASLLALPNVFLNGSLDILLSNIVLSKGAYDNGTGVVSSLALLNWMSSMDNKYTYRFLFAGMEEYGLRGSRRHVSGLSGEEWNKCVMAINIDMIARKGPKVITVTDDVSDVRLLQGAIRISEVNSFNLIKATLPPDASSDFHSFMGQSFGKDFVFSLKANAVGAFIPQRSYFTRNKSSIPVINFSDDEKFTAADFISILSPVSFGTVHSFHDKLGRVSANNLVEYSRFFKLYIESIDRYKP